LSGELNIAIVSTNKDKYSETFIHNHLRLLPGKIHFLFDGYLPKRYSTDKGLSENVFNPVSTTENAEMELERAIARYLTAQKVQVILCEYGPSGVALLNVAKQTGIPLVVHFFGYDAYRHDVLSTYGLQYPRLFEQAAAVVVVSVDMHAQLLGLGCSPDKLQVLYCGVDTGLFSSLQAVEKSFDVIACGRFVGKKSPQTTLRAFAAMQQKCPSATLVMVGDGELLEPSRQLAQELGLGASVCFTGALTLDETASLYARARLFAQHSVATTDNDKEGTPLALLMAGACGLPVVSTRHGGIPDVVEEGKDGYLVNEHDVEGMAEAMFHLLTQPELNKTMGQHFRNKVVERFSLNGYTARLFDVLNKAANSQNKLGV